MTHVEQCWRLRSSKRCSQFPTREPVVSVESCSWYMKSMTLAESLSEMFAYRFMPNIISIIIFVVYVIICMIVGYSNFWYSYVDCVNVLSACFFVSCFHCFYFAVIWRIKMSRPIVISALALINAVNRHWARLLLGWVTVYNFTTIIIIIIVIIIIIWQRRRRQN